LGRRKLNLTLPEDLWVKLHSHVPKRKISQYVSEATAARLAEEERIVLRERLREQYQARAARDLKLAEEFFASEQESTGQIEGSKGE
jgi:hypothetical protein